MDLKTVQEIERAIGALTSQELEEAGRASRSGNLVGPSAIKRTDGYLWFWIGDHDTYGSLIS